MADRVSSVYLFFDDFESGIIELDSHERGVYFTIILRYYATAGRLYDDDRTLARNCNCSLQAYRKTKAKLIALGKIAVVDGMIYQPRAEQELKASWDRLEKWKAWKRKKDQKNIEKSFEFKPENPNKNSGGKQQPKPEGVGFPLSGENPTPNAQPQFSHSDTSPPSLLEGGGDVSNEGARALRGEVREKLTPQLHRGLISIRELQEFLASLRGGSVESGLMLAPGYDPPENLRGVLTAMCIPLQALPKLQAIPGGKS